ncbi:type I 3-dehydroquinate dehydratase [bacterium]|nr:type I 3-dehydroquinate dehydratase [bacterium]
MENLGTRPYIVAVLDKAFIETARSAQKLGADILELRVDMLDPCYHTGEKVSSVIRQLKKEVKLPVILTIRSSNEGGMARITDSRRLDIFREAISETDLVDIEISSDRINSKVIELAKTRNKKVILSYHNFEKTPALSYLKNQAEKALDMGCDILKIAAMANNIEDVRRLLNFCSVWKKTKISVMSMGYLSEISRLTGFLFGSCLIYGFIDKPAVSGQLSVKNLVKYYHILYPL